VRSAAVLRADFGLGWAYGKSTSIFQEAASTSSNVCAELGGTSVAQRRVWGLLVWGCKNSLEILVTLGFLLRCSNCSWLRNVRLLLTCGLLCRRVSSRLCYCSLTVTFDRGEGITKLEPTFNFNVCPGVCIKKEATLVSSLLSSEKRMP